MILSEAQKILADILGPATYDDFFDLIAAEKPLVLLGSSNQRRAQLAGLDPKAALLSGFAKYAQNLTCHIQKATVPPPEAKAVESAEAFAALIREFHQRDYTVRFPDVTELSPELSQFTRALEFVFQNPAGVVVFWSEGGAKAPVHHDEVDVIVIQLVGTKRWFISDATPTLPNQWRGLGETSAVMNAFKTYDVQPGDLLYVPRGTVHTVESISESIHLSIGFVPVTQRDAIIAALDLLSDLDKPLRSNLAPRADHLATRQSAAQIHMQIRQGVEKLKQICQSDLFIRDALNFRRSRMIQQLPKLPVHAMQTINSVHTKVRHNPLAIAGLFATDDILDFRQPGQQHLIHLGAEASVRFILSRQEFSVSEIPGDVSDDVRIALVNKMLAGGYLEVLD